MSTDTRDRRPEAAGRVRAAVNRLREATRTQLWPVPTLGVVVAVVIGVALPRLDVAIAGDLPAFLRAYLFGGGAGAARTVLDAIASSLITVTSLTFSLTVVTLQLASSQFSPRLLRSFTQDQVVQRTLALFLATFTYALTVLRTVRTEQNGQSAFVPQVSVTLAFALAIASVLGLVFFLAHLAALIRVETMVRNVHTEATATVRRSLTERDAAADKPEWEQPPAYAVAVLARSSGFLIGVDDVALVRAATNADALLLVDRQLGSSIVAGTPLAFCWPRQGPAFDGDTQSVLQRKVAEALTTGFERTAAQDFGYGLRQLTDVATKALSPGINDPTTAIHALGHSSALLCELAGRQLGSQVLCDADKRVRVVLHRPDLGDLLELAVAQPRRYGAADPEVLYRLMILLRELAWCAAPELRPVVTAQLPRLRATIAAQDFDLHERDRLAVAAENVERAIAGRWTPADTTP